MVFFFLQQIPVCWHVIKGLLLSVSFGSWSHGSYATANTELGSKVYQVWERVQHATWTTQVKLTLVNVVIATLLLKMPFWSGVEDRSKIKQGCYADFSCNHLPPEMPGVICKRL